MTAEHDATTVGILRVLSSRSGLPLFNVTVLAQCCAISRDVLQRRMSRAGYAVPTDQRGLWCLTPAGLAAIEAVRNGQVRT